jgi:hypothetical protein
MRRRSVGLALVVVAALSLGSTQTPVDGRFTIVVLPDTQHYTEEDQPGLHQIFHQQTQWIADNRRPLNIQAVIHLGDIVQRANSSYEWKIADAAVRRLEPAAIPLAFAHGNHDSVYRSSSAHPQFFGFARFAKNPGYCGAGVTDGRTYATCHLVDNGWIVIALGWISQWGDLTGVTTIDGIPHARARLPLQFMREKLSEHPTRKGIVVFHGYLREDGTRIQEYDWTFSHALAPQANLVMVLNGHELGRQAEHYRVDVVHGRAVHQMLSNYQSRANGGDGWLRILQIDDSAGVVSVQTFSPTRNEFERDGNSEFTFRIDGTGSTPSDARTPAPPSNLRIIMR